MCRTAKWKIPGCARSGIFRRGFDLLATLPTADQALADKDLYLTVMDHRRIFIGLHGFDYQTLLPQTLSILPPAEVRDAWKKDYQSMQESMIYEESPSFEQLISKLAALNQRINALSY